METRYQQKQALAHTEREESIFLHGVSLSLAGFPAPVHSIYPTRKEVIDETMHVSTRLSYQNDLPLHDTPQNRNLTCLIGSTLRAFLAPLTAFISPITPCKDLVAVSAIERLQSPFNTVLLGGEPGGSHDPKTDPSKTVLFSEPNQQKRRTHPLLRQTPSSVSPQTPIAQALKRTEQAPRPLGRCLSADPQKEGLS